MCCWARTGLCTVKQCRRCSWCAACAAGMRRTNGATGATDVCAMSAGLPDGNSASTAWTTRELIRTSGKPARRRSQTRKVPMCADRPQAKHIVMCADRPQAQNVVLCADRPPGTTCCTVCRSPPGTKESIKQEDNVEQKKPKGRHGQTKRYGGPVSTTVQEDAAEASEQKKTEKQTKEAPTCHICGDDMVPGDVCVCYECRRLAHTVCGALCELCGTWVCRSTACFIRHEDNCDGGLTDPRGTVEQRGGRLAGNSRSGRGEEQK